MVEPYIVGRMISSSNLESAFNYRDSCITMEAEMKHPKDPDAFLKYIEERKERSPEFKRAMEFEDILASRDEWFCDFCSELDDNGFEITEMPMDEFTRDVENPHAKRIARTISLQLTKLQRQIGALVLEKAVLETLVGNFDDEYKN